MGFGCGCLLILGSSSACIYSSRVWGFEFGSDDGGSGGFARAAREMR